MAGSARNLQRTRLSKSYTHELDRGWMVLRTYCLKMLGVVLVLSEFSEDAINELLVTFIQRAYEHSRSHYHLVKHAVLSVQVRRPYFRGRLRRAWESLESWGLERTKRLRTALPLPILLCYGIVARTLACEREGIQAHQWWSLSVLCEAAFYGFLRPIEFLNLRRCMVNLPGNLASIGEFAVVAIFEPKNRRFLGDKQFSTIRSTQSTLWLEWLCKGLSPAHKLWPYSHQIFRDKLKTLSHMLGLGDWKVGPSSFRPGGCTHFFSSGVEVSRLLFYGRWLSEKSLKHYIQESISQQLLLTLGETQSRTFNAILEKGEHLLSPPAKNWWELSRRPDVAPGAQSLLPQRRVQPSVEWRRLYPKPT